MNIPQIHKDKVDIECIALSHEKKIFNLMLTYKENKKKPFPYRLKECLGEKTDQNWFIV